MSLSKATASCIPNRSPARQQKERSVILTILAPQEKRAPGAGTEGSVTALLTRMACCGSWLLTIIIPSPIFAGTALGVLATGSSLREEIACRRWGAVSSLEKQ